MDTGITSKQSTENTNKLLKNAEIFCRSDQVTEQVVVLV